MSWFTASPGVIEPCPRCKKLDFVQLVKRCEAFVIFDCRKCAPVPQKEKR